MQILNDRYQLPNARSLPDKQAHRLADLLVIALVSSSSARCRLPSPASLHTVVEEADGRGYDRLTLRGNRVLCQELLSASS